MVLPDRVCNPPLVLARIPGLGACPASFPRLRCGANVVVGKFQCLSGAPPYLCAVGLHRSTADAISCVLRITLRRDCLLVRHYPRVEQQHIINFI
ncbi:hypothetical protein NDU88_008120 [Pleurodeles waltl]|uniref:Uncharacterized protein n=1 Tax=Pleurodeles waltl TaxID=8319 RepID=A0AAV7PVQ8_PLEWA|nr:hypothetical protein NDU88_008120 [Pleurodeles waltl]